MIHPNTLFPSKGWFETLASRDHLTRLKASEALRDVLFCATLDAQASFCEAGLCHQDLNVRAETARIVGDLRLSKLLPSLHALLQNRHQPQRVHKAVLYALRCIQSPQSAPVLSNSWEHPQPMMRRAAVMALGQIGGKSALAALQKALNDEAWQVRMEAATGLGGMREEFAESCIETLDKSLYKEPHAATAERMVRHLTEAALRSLAPARIAPTLARLLQNDDRWEVRRACARGLGELGDPGALEILRAFQNDPWVEVAEESHWAILALSREAHDEQSTQD